MIQLTIYVSDITTVISVFSHIRIYTSASETGTYAHLVYIPLAAGQSTYTYLHTAGTSETWYKSSYWSNSTESSLSDAVQGSEPELYHYPTYPDEVEFSTFEMTIIRKIRRLIGDLKDVGRIYSESGDACSSVMDDNQTLDMAEKGWPVYVSINDIEYTSITDPYVQGYRYLTFSGTLVSGSQNPEVDLWFYTFKFSDKEIYQAYNDAMTPPLISSTNVNQDMLILQTAIDLLQSMYAEDVVGDGAMIRDDQSLYDPSPGLREREQIIARLQKMLDALVKQYMFGSITGILID